MQTPNERTFDLWVKTIAIELIRQTPLEAVKYLDILTFADSWYKTKHQQQHHDDDDSSRECFLNPLPTSCNVCQTTHHHHHQPQQQQQDQLLNRQLNQQQRHQREEEIDINRNHVNKLMTSTSNLNDEEACVELLLKRCQNVENYVSVKEKLVLFESLCKLGRVRSSEDVSLRNNTSSCTATSNNNNNKRARSLHDLSNCIVNNGVREICKYFERKTDQSTIITSNINDIKTNKRLIYSDSSLHKNKNRSNVS